MNAAIELTTAKRSRAQSAALVLAGFLFCPFLGAGASTAFAAERSHHWAYQPLRFPAPPDGGLKRPDGWARTAIDAFIWRTFQRRRLSASPPADRRTLLRRVSFDLTGMPPSRDEQDAFLRDTSPDAYERVVDRLLASPHHGERWARHWMDVVHFAETHGHDQDRPRDHAWPYRDYLIRSLNEDKPYARFVKEQIAGDVLFPGDAWALRATGFAAAGPWDESSLRDIQAASIDRKIGHYLDRDDMVRTTMSTFVSTTVHCARCHDHKFDPVSQEEYYRLQAVFAGVDKANRKFDPDPEVGGRRRRLEERLKRLQTRPVMAAAVAGLSEAELAKWESQRAESIVAWRVLKPVEWRSSSGSILKLQPDGSILAGGPRPDRDTYVITAHTDLPRVTGIRLEVLTDKSLPKKGPGRQDNGNLHLNEIRVTVYARGGEREAAGRSVTLASPSSDFDQSGWSIAGALDKDPGTAWGIYPQVGVPHRAVFVCGEPITIPGGAKLKFELQQTHGGGHLIGRLRLSVTDAAPPFEATALPVRITDILTTPRARRTGPQSVELAAYVLEKRLARELASLPAQETVYCATNKFQPDGSFRPARKPRPVHLLERGSIHKPGPPARAGTLSCVPGLPGEFHLEDPDDEGARRVALECWLADSRNVLTWRSIANRLWHYHFGRGIADTPNDFGRMGGAPSHPDLLDWLASALLERGGSLKSLHRLMVTSAVYRQSSRYKSRYAAIDADNRYLWRMNRRRLDAESIRDAMLVISETLDATMGGPSVRQFVLKKGVHVTPVVDYTNFDVNHPANYRRSVYRFIFRTLPDPFMESLDCPDASQLTPRRTESITALQALSMLNDKFVVRQSELIAELAARVAAVSNSGAEHVDGEWRAKVGVLYRRIHGRAPRRGELLAVAEYAKQHGLANACRFLLNSNEFMFVD